MSEEEEIANINNMNIEEIANILLNDEQNAILLADRMNRQYPKNGDVYYIDMSGIVRVTRYKGKWIIVDGYDMPSKIKGKTIGELWNTIERGEKKC